MSVLVNAVEHDEIAKGARIDAAKRKVKHAGDEYREGHAHGEFAAEKAVGRGATRRGAAAYGREAAAGEYSPVGGSRPSRAYRAGGTVGSARYAARAKDVTTKKQLREQFGKAAHRLGESNTTAIYQAPGNSSSIAVGNQRTAGGDGAGANAIHRGYGKQIKVKPRKGRAGAVMAGAALAGGGIAAARSHPMSKSAFGVELGKALGDDTGLRGGVRSDYVPAPKATGTPPGVLKARKALAPLKSAALAAAKR